MNINFDTLILSAGMGTRLKPLTLKTPKPLFALNDSSTILTRLFNQLQSCSSSLYINISYLPELFLKAFENGHLQNCIFLWEPIILGSHNTLSLVSQETKKGILVCHGDLVMEERALNTFISKVVESPQQSFMVIHRRASALSRSSVHVNELEQITNFSQGNDSTPKEKFCFSNSGLYYFSREDLEFMKKHPIVTNGVDLTSTLIPELVKMRLLKSHLWNGTRISVDSIEALRNARAYIHESMRNRHKDLD